MPEALSYVLEAKDRRAFTDIEEAYRDEHNERAAALKEGWDYYNGDHAEPLKVQKDGYNDNVMVNHVEAIADRITAFVVGDGITFDTGGDRQEDDGDSNIETLWQMNRGDLLIENLVLSGAIEGHVTVRLQPGEGLPQITRIRQAHFAAFWNPFNVRDVLWYRLQHITGSRGKRIDYVRGMVDEQTGEVDHDAEGWTEVVFASQKAQADGVASWELMGMQEWPFEWPPLVDWQNLPNANGYYGRNDVKSAIALNDALNFILSNTQRIIKHFAAPKTVGLGFNAGDVKETQVGGLFTVDKPSSETDVFNLEMQSDGALIQWLNDIITMGLWNSGGMVDPQTMKDRVGQLTNFGLKVLFANAIKRTQKKRLLYAEAFEKINQYALELAGLAIPESVETIWPDVLPEDDETVSNVLLQELQAGLISKMTYRALRGYDNEQEEDRLAEETSNGNLGTNILGLIANNRTFNGGR